MIATETIAYLNSNEPNEPNLLAIGSHKELMVSQGKDPFSALQLFLEQNPSWVFGYLGYDLKNHVELLKSENHDGLGFADIRFFVPKAVYSELNGEFTLVKSYDLAFSETLNPSLYLKHEEYTIKSPIHLSSRTPKNVYFQRVNALLEHIQRGDIYEANYCVEFYHEKISLAPVATYWQVNQNTKAPYSAYFRHQGHHAISGSPELYLEKKGDTITSKPIKGTRKRGETLEEDELLKAELLADQKERSENVMIVDLVRNDLSKTAQKDSVKVSELYGIYSFDTVHHMISTVTSKLDSSCSAVDVLKSTFPMGSMTGAPKISAMELIEELEDAKRGLYSGAVGCFTPDGDFTFNVVIRTLLYNAHTQYLSLMAGGAITSKSTAEQEYREVLLKAAAIKKAIVEHS
ncbi:MAG: anthranilate synthase component I family protein [Flavobacteriales bacterium]